MSADRPDIQFAVKEVARHMSAPMAHHWNEVMRIGRYLKSHMRVVLKFRWQSELKMVSAYTDSDWAGCKSTGRSTSGGALMIGRHLVKSYSKQQRTIALSSAEAELHAMVAASSEAIGLIGLCRDMGLAVEGEVFCDSSAALGIAQRLGTGKLRHVRI